ncbi:hypothetical protein [Methanobacterium ferruginis]|uniref:hypothetical protein n=1 Tax=Methanobacterium ferruginis TaxID=710191 RepID=UPI002573547F|nr:hypothetical protein [Methanobacterium ferruginis]
MAEAKEQKIKVKIPETSNWWDPKKIGECLVGTYCKKQPTTFNGRKNTIYNIKSESCPIRDRNDMVKFYGTVVLNDVLGKIKPGYDVEIIYRGEQPSKDRKKKPMKLFDVSFLVDPTDPILEKIYPDGLPADIQEQVDKLTDSTGVAGDDEDELNTLNNKDNREIQVFLDGVEQDLRDGNKEVTEANVWNLAREQVEDDTEFLELVKMEIRERTYPTKEGE